MTKIVPYFAQTATATIVIDGVTYRVPLVDAAGHLQVDVVSTAPATGAATSANQATMITALELLDNLITALATVGTDQLRTDVISTVLPALAATSTKQDTMITALQLIDDLRGALAAVHADRLNVNVFATGASEVATVRLGTVADSSTRVTVVTPSSGKKIRIVSVGLHNRDVTRSLFQVYFGTGASITTNPTKAIHEAHLGADHVGNSLVVWPDGGGPVGAADEVVSLAAAPDITTSGAVILHYREE